MQRKVMTIGVVAGVLALLIGGLALAQQGGGGGRQRGQGGQGGPGGGNFDPAQMRQRMMDRMKEQLGVKDDAEWKIIEPRLTKVMEAGRQVGGGGRGMFGMMGGRGGRGGQGGPGGADNGGAPAQRRGSGPGGEQTALDKAVAQLDTVLQKESASPEEIKTAMTAVRAAREKAKQELAAAQAELKKVLTVRQEAVLMTMNQID
jgi:hypothetical protein